MFSTILNDFQKGGADIAPPDLPAAMLNQSATGDIYPTHLHLLRLENGWPLYALTQEVGLTPDPDDCRDFGPHIPIQHDSTPIFLTLHLDGQWVPAGNATLQQVLDFRREGMAMLFGPGSASYPLPALKISSSSRWYC